MKLLVFSDSHHRTCEMIAAIEVHQPDTVLHLGDVMSDTRKLRQLFSQLPIVQVPGNCDGWTQEPAIKLIELEGKKILLSHGHLWGVKQSYDTAIHAAHKAAADLLLFGHTHVPYSQPHGDLWVMNPGPSPDCFGLITIQNDQFQCEILPTVLL